jgi:hypothetical protein
MVRGYPPTAVLFTYPTHGAVPGTIENVIDVTDVPDDELREHVEPPTQLDSVHRVWVTPSERRRCTYVTRDEQPVADSHDNGHLRF